MPNKDALTLVRRVRRLPGWRVQPTRDGWRCLPPDPRVSAVVVHRTPSNYRAVANLRAQLRRAGAEV